MPRDRDLVRRAALILSSDRPIRELFRELCAMLSEHIDAEIVLIALAPDGIPEIAYAYIDGAGGDPDDGTLRRGSTTQRVFDSSVSVRYDRSSDWPVQNPVALRGVSHVSESALFVPILFGGSNVGVLSVQSTIPEAYGEDDIVMLETCALYLGARVNDDERRKAVERAERLATIDELTGVANRSALDKALDREWRRALRAESAISFLMIDVDFFKSFNDTYGHVAGDSCLQQIANAAQRCLERPTDLFARYGGEEFAAVLADTDRQGAVTIGEAIREAIGRLDISHDGSSLGHVSVSIGVAGARPGRGDEAVTMVRAADAALYEAKQGGRNRVAAQGYVSTSRRAEQRKHARGNLPVSRTRFIGRRHDCARLLSAVGEHRLSTAIGPGGVGKTRIALEVARAIDDLFPDGVWFVDLTAVADASGLVAHVSSSLHGLVPPHATLSDLVAALRTFTALIVLDNCEHVVESCAELVTEILAGAPDVRILVTSREALAVEGEFVYRIPTLEIDEGTALFIDRATNAGVAEAASDATAIGEIIRQLDGIPLAIELAAPRLSTMSLEELRSALVDRLSLLRNSSRRAPSRQQTLRAMMDWSYRLLSPDEQVVFRRLAVFVGGWTRDAAIEVCADASVPPAMVAVALDSFAAKSLVQPESTLEDARAHLLETTREYAAETLERSGEAAEMVARHAQTYLRVAGEAGKRRLRVPSTQWFHEVTVEGGNLQAALFALLDASRFEDAAGMLIALCDWLWDRGAQYATDLTKRLDDVLKKHRDLAPHVRAAFELAIVTCLRRVAAQRSLDISKPLYAYYSDLGQTHLAAMTLRVLVQSELMLRGYIEAEWEGDLETVAEAMKAAGETALASTLYNMLGTMHTQSMDDRRLGDALTSFDKAIVLLESRGDRDRAGILYGNSGDVAFYLGHLDEAMERSRKAVSLIENSEQPWLASFQYMNLGAFATWSAQFDIARDSLTRARFGLAALGEGYIGSTLLDKFARLAYATRRPDRAVRLLGAADASFERNRISRQRREGALLEQMRAELRGHLGETFETEYRQGREMPGEAVEAEISAI